MSNTNTLNTGQNQKTSCIRSPWVPCLRFELPLVESVAVERDRDGKFVSDMWSTIFGKLSIKRHFTAAYYHQVDGKSERAIQTVEIYLGYAIAYQNNISWPDVLPQLQATPNSPQLRRHHNMLM
jgi:hypothetical protein